MYVEDENFAKNFYKSVGADKLLTSFIYSNQCFNREYLHFHGLLTFEDFVNYITHEDFPKTLCYVEYMLQLAALLLDCENFKQFYQFLKDTTYQFTDIILRLSGFQMFEDEKNTKNVAQNLELIIRDFGTIESCFEHRLFNHKFLSKICDKVFNCYTHINNTSTNFENYKIFKSCEQLLEIHALYRNENIVVFPSKEIFKLLLQQFKNNYQSNCDFYISEIKNLYSNIFTNFETFVKSENFEIENINIQILNDAKIIEIKVSIISNENPNTKKLLVARDSTSNPIYRVIQKLLDKF